MRASQLERLSVRPKKYLGQHFLTSEFFAREIVDAIPAGPGERVLEIGPGRGALSIFLKERFPEVHLVEIDKDAINHLKEKLGHGVFTIHEADVLEFNFEKVGFPIHVVGNLPYVIGALIIKKTLLLGAAIRSFTFMVQREVAERIVSGPPDHFLPVFRTCNNAVSTSSRRIFSKAQDLFRRRPDSAGQPLHFKTAAGRLGLLLRLRQPRVFNAPEEAFQCAESKPGRA